jgi:predicted MPP superfamily phosphohydrolase
MSESSEATLPDLFASLFTAEELRRWVQLNFGPEVANALPGPPASLAELAFQLADVLEKRGLIDDRLFQLLSDERPGRRHYILAVRRRRMIGKKFGWATEDSKEDLLPSDDAAQSPPEESSAQPVIARPAPRKLLALHAPADEVYWHKLSAHLGPLFRQGRIESWNLAFVATELHQAAVQATGRQTGSTLLQAMLEDITADILVVLLSAELLDSQHTMSGAFEEILREATRCNAAVLPVVVRPCLWADTPFVRYPVLPHGGRTIATASSPDEALLEIVEAITAILDDSPATPAEETPLTEEHEEATPAPAPAPAHVVMASAVFRTTSMPTHTLVETPQLHDLRYEMAVPGRLLVVEGPSGIGKTVAVKNACAWITANGHRRWESTYLNVKEPSDVARIDALLQQPTAALRGFMIIDDFHDLDPVRKRRLGNHAKALADRDEQDAKLVFVGIPRVRESLARDVPDLGSRMTTVRIRRVEVAHIRELIEKGEQALNIEFVHRARLAVGAQGSFIVAQRLCETAVRKAHVWDTQRTQRRLDLDVPQLLPAVLDSLQAELYPRVQEFAMQDDEVAARGAALALLWHLRESDDGSMQISYVRPRYPEQADAFGWLLKRFADPALSGKASWRSLFYCDPAGGQIAIEDPKLHFYLKHLNWEQLGRDSGVELRVLPDNGQLGFISPRQRTSTNIGRMQTPASAAQGRVQQEEPLGPVVRILHLSDFHFRPSTTWDASTVLGRLSVDIARLARTGLAPDIIVLTGDIAYSGKRAEYDLARTWITTELLPAAGVGADRLVIVPGNHDVDRSRVDFVAQQVTRGIRDERNQQRVTEVLDGDGRSLLLRRLDEFMALVNDLGAAGAPLVRPWYQAIFEIEGMTLHCAAMASAWLSGDDSDYGGLLLGLRQCNEVMSGADSADVVLVALHHPWDYVAEWDRRASLAEIERSAGVVLRGHLHESRYDYRESTRHAGLIELAAGACYETSQHPNSYHLIELRPRAPKQRRARIHVRYWDPARRDWRAERNAFDGDFGELPLRVRG